jgi:two-component system, NtrC family, sensor kinase
MKRNLRQLIRENFSLKIYLSFLMAIILISGIFNLVFFQWQKEYLKQEITGQGQLLARVLAHNAVLGVFSENENQLQAPMQSIMKQQDVLTVAVYNHDGELLAQAQRGDQPGDGLPDNLASIKKQRELLLGQEPVSTEDRHRLLFSQPVLLSLYSSEDALYFEDVPLEEKVIGYVQVVMSKERLRSSIRDLFARNLAIGLLVLLIGGVFTFFVLRQVTGPLNRLIGEVEKQGIRTESKDQLSMLSGTFENMVRQLSEAFETINQLNAGLELKVEIRTGELAEANEELRQRQIFLEETNRKLEEALLQLKETQAQMVHSEKMAALGQLVAGVAHEINNTTNFITGALPALERKLGNVQELLAIYEEIDRRATKKIIAGKLAEAEELRDEFDYERLLASIRMLLANIMEGARRTSQIVKDLKNFARPGSAEWKAVDIHQSIDSTLTLLYSEYKHQIEVTRDYQPDLPPVVCSPSQLNQVFMNLLLNAAQAIEGPGKIHIATRKIADHLHITFRDTGGGIPEKIRDRIFEPFFTTKPVGRGTGLGLSISYGIIKKHQGNILVRSIPGEGTEFEIILPMAGPESIRAR